MNSLMTALANAATVWTWILGILVGLLAVVISIIVAMQSTKEGGLSGTIAGSGESFFGKSKAMTKDRFLSRLTLVLSIVFVVLVLVLTILVSSTMANG